MDVIQAMTSYFILRKRRNLCFYLLIVGDGVFLSATLKPTTLGVPGTAVGDGVERLERGAMGSDASEAVEAVAALLTVSWGCVKIEGVDIDFKGGALGWVEVGATVLADTCLEKAVNDLAVTVGISAGFAGTPASALVRVTESLVLGSSNLKNTSDKS